MPSIPITNSTLTPTYSDPTESSGANLLIIPYTLAAVAIIIGLIVFLRIVIKKCKSLEWYPNVGTRHTLREVVYNPPKTKITRKKMLLKDKVYRLHHKADLYRTKPPRPWRHEEISLNNFSQQVLFESQVHLFELHGKHITITPVKNLECIYERCEEMEEEDNGSSITLYPESTSSFCSNDSTLIGNDSP